MGRRRMRRRLAATVLAVSCAVAPPMELVDARQAFERARSGPAAKLAAADLRRAGVTLEAAERAFRAHQPEASELGYAAGRQVRRAEAIAAEQQERATAAQATRQYEAAQRAALEAALAAGGEAETRAGDGSPMEQEARIATHEARVLAAADAQRRAAEARAAEMGRTAERDQPASPLDAERGAAAMKDQRARAAMSELERLAAVREEPRGTVVTLSGPALFRAGDDRLLPTAMRRLDDVATALTTRPSGAIVIEGFADARSAAAGNQRLSLARAEAVRGYLIGRGVAGERIRVAGPGSSRPVAGDATAPGRANDRSVEIVLPRATPAAR